MVEITTSRTQVEKARLPVEAEHVGQVRLGDVTVYQHDLAVALKCKTQCEVDRRERLAFAGQCTGDDQYVAKVQPILTSHSRKQRPLDHAVFRRELALLFLRGDEARGSQRRNVDANRAIAAARQGATLYRRTQCGRVLRAVCQLTDRLRDLLCRPLGAGALEEFHGLFDETHGLARKVGQETAANVTSQHDSYEDHHQRRAGHRNPQHF